MEDNMEQPKLDKPLPRFKPNPLVASLPEHLKDPANYMKIKKAIADTMKKCHKSHADVGEMATCWKCSDGMLERRALLKRLGFKNPAQYRKWQEINNKIKELYPLVDWTKENEIRRALNQ